MALAMTMLLAPMVVKTDENEQNNSNESDQAKAKQQQSQDPDIAKVSTLHYPRPFSLQLSVVCGVKWKNRIRYKSKTYYSASHSLSIQRFCILSGGG